MANKLAQAVYDRVWAYISAVQPKGSVRLLLVALAYSYGERPGASHFARLTGVNIDLTKRNLRGLRNAGVVRALHQRADGTWSFCWELNLEQLGVSVLGSEDLQASVKCAEIEADHNAGGPSGNPAHVQTRMEGS
jgi:hypothetical protein